MRQEFLPFSRPTIGAEEIAEVVDTLQSGWLTTGPKVARFEQALAERLGVKYVVATNSGTAALHIALLAAEVGPGDEIITTDFTFAATVNMIIAVGARPVLVDVDRDTLNLLPEGVAAAVTNRTKAIIPVHFAGLPCNMAALQEIAARHGLLIVEDAAHALGASYNGCPIGSLSWATIFSFHPIKNITTGEGGALCTNDEALAKRAMRLRFHGLSREAWARYTARGAPQYDVWELGYKYNMLDLQAAIGLPQLARLDALNARRRQLAALYQEALSDIPELQLPPEARPEDTHAWHLFVVKVLPEKGAPSRDEFMAALKERNIGTGLHFRAIHQHPYYAQTLGYSDADLPNAAWASERVCSLPLFPQMKEEDVHDVAAAIRDVLWSGA